MMDLNPIISMMVVFLAPSWLLALKVIPFLSIGTITGELPRFQAGVTMEISCLDAWYSDKDGTLECRATYIVKGLCRRCCLPEVILRCMQVSVSLMGSGVLPDCHDTLIELVGSPETDFLHLFSQQQLQEFLLFEREYSICKMEITVKSQYCPRS